MEWEDYIASEEKYEELNALGEEMVSAVCDYIGLQYEGDVDKSIALIKKSIYRNTNCGAWIQIPKDEDIRVIIGSIVEGVDIYCQEYVLDWPFSKDEFWGAVGEVEEEAEYIWNETHGCEDCWGGDPGMEESSEYGYRPVDPNCKSCEGDGIVI